MGTLGNEYIMGTLGYEYIMGTLGNEYIGFGGPVTRIRKAADKAIGLGGQGSGGQMPT